MPKWVSIVEAARLTGQKYATVYRHVRDGHIVARRGFVRRGDGGNHE